MKIIFYILITSLQYFRSSNATKCLTTIRWSWADFFAEAVLFVEQLSWASIPLTVFSVTAPPRVPKFWNQILLANNLSRSCCYSNQAPHSTCTYRHFHHFQFIAGHNMNLPVACRCYMTRTAYGCSHSKYMQKHGTSNSKYRLQLS